MTNTDKAFVRANLSATDTPAQVFTARTMPANSQWYGGAYGNGRFVTVPYGSSGSAYSSNEGASWSTGNLLVSRNWAAVGFGNSTFVAVANTASVCAISSDGNTWAQRNLPASRTWNGVAYGNGTWVAVASDAAFGAYSTDNGATWTQCVTPSGLFNVAYGNGIWVAVGPSPGGASSPDGITWTARTLPTVTSGNWLGVAYGNGRFVAVCAGSTTITQAAVSYDGINWTQTTIPGNNWTAVTYSSGSLTFMAVGVFNNYVATSTDGVTWTSKTVAANNSFSVMASPSTFVVANSGTVAFTSPASGPIIYTTTASSIFTDLIVSNPSSAGSITATVLVDNVPLLYNTPIAASSLVQMNLRQVVASGKAITAYATGSASIAINGVEIT
jgi:hypothetical protein